MKLSYALSPLSQQLPHRSWLLSSTRHWLNANSCGATFSLGLGTPCKTSPQRSLRHARGDEEHPLARKRMKIQSIITACVDTGIQHGLHENEVSWVAHTRFAELGIAGIDHTRLWRLNPPTRTRGRARGVR